MSPSSTPFYLFPKHCDTPAQPYSAHSNSVPVELPPLRKHSTPPDTELSEHPLKIFLSHDQGTVLNLLSPLVDANCALCHIRN